MLAEFDHAKQELSRIAAELKRLEEKSADGNNGERTFLKSRARDVLRHIYVDSPATIEHISEVFSHAPISEILATIEGALKLGPPIRLALNSEDDGRTVQALVDSALWRSKAVRFCGYAAIGMVLIALALLGVNVAEISKQADSARQLVANANAKLEQMSVANRALEEKQREIEDRSAVIFSRIDAAKARLDNPNDDVNRIVIRFETELTRLGDLEREWIRRREKLSENLTLHDIFLTGREEETTRKVTEFNKRVSEHVSAVEAIVERTRNLEIAVTTSAAKSKESAETIAALIAPAQAITTNLQTLRGQTVEMANSVRENNERIATTRREVESAQDRIRQIDVGLREDVLKRLGELDRVASAAENAKGKIDSAVQAATEEQRRFEAHIQSQRPIFDGGVLDAVNVVTATKNTAITSINGVVGQATASLSSWQTTGNQHLELIRTMEGQATNRTGEINRIAAQMGNLQTEIVTRIEGVKTAEQRLKGEVDRVRLEVGNIQEVITVIEDKRADIVSKLHKLLDERPSMESALVWKLILGSRTLSLLTVGTISLFIILLAVQILIFFTLRRQRNAHNLTG